MLVCLRPVLVCLQLGLEFLRQALAWLPVPEFLLLELESLQPELASLLVLVLLRPELASLRQQEYPQQEPLVFQSWPLQPWSLPSERLAS